MSPNLTPSASEILTNLLIRLTSRKFLVAVVAFITTLIAPLDPQSKAVIGAAVAAVYILIEGLVDRAEAQNPPDTTHTTVVVNEPKV